MKPDWPTLVGWLLMLALIAASLIGAWMLSGENVDGVLALFERLAERGVERPVSTALAFVAIFALTTALTLPTATLLCICAGYLFGIPTGTAISLAGAIGGAAITFITVRSLARERVRDYLLRGRTRGLIRMLERDAFFFLVVFRIVPVAPFFAINAAGALIRISPGRYLLATALGLIPITLIYVSVGAGFETLLDAGELHAGDVLREPRIALPLLALVALLIGGLLGRRAVRRRRRPAGSLAGTMGVQQDR